MTLPILPLDLAPGERAALQFSGGRDSLACVYALRKQLDALTVYWLDSGDNFPETLATAAHVEAMVPHFRRIATEREAIIAEHGWPSDLIPPGSTPMGRITDAAAIRLQSRYDCCARVVMHPLHQAMIDDGIDVIIRGQRNADSIKSPVRSGDQLDGFRFVFPLQEWSDAEVMAFLAEVEAPVPAFYEILSGAPDCMGCTGWWEERRSRYLKTHHPQTYARYRQRLELIATELMPHVDHLLHELGEPHE